jgi:hypothetical protein
MLRQQLHIILLLLLPLRGVEGPTMRVGCGTMRRVAGRVWVQRLKAASSDYPQPPSFWWLLLLLLLVVVERLAPCRAQRVWATVGGCWP